MQREKPDPQAASRCPRCGHGNACGFGQATPCWCSQKFNRVLPMPVDGQACYCADCLRQIMAERATARAALEPEKGE
ncbi:MAG: hypothetical protein C5B46_09725 [Proteobacteria bacterium]|nr:MAG: hypothetical protein C5B46_09725 [Pseudomonadota bacterium]